MSFLNKVSTRESFGSCMFSVFLSDNFDFYDSSVAHLTKLLDSNAWLRIFFSSPR